MGAGAGQLARAHAGVRLYCTSVHVGECGVGYGKDKSYRKANDDEEARIERIAAVIHWGDAFVGNHYQTSRWARICTGARTYQCRDD